MQSAGTPAIPRFSWLWRMHWCVHSARPTQFATIAAPPRLHRICPASPPKSVRSRRRWPPGARGRVMVPPAGQRANAIRMLLRRRNRTDRLRRAAAIKYSSAHALRDHPPKVRRESDRATLARAEIEYACIELSSGRPTRWPPEFRERYVALDEVVRAGESLAPV